MNLNEIVVSGSLFYMLRDSLSSANVGTEEDLGVSITCISEAEASVDGFADCSAFKASTVSRIKF